MADGANEGSAAMLGSAVLWDDPCLSARKSPAKNHYSVRRVGSLGNSIDGSGSWVAFHLLDEDGNFVQGGWIPQNTRDQQPRTKEAANIGDENERSVAPAGSVAGEPVAWAAMREDGDIAWIGYTPEGAADGACGRQVVPLYCQPQPALTDAERTAVLFAARRLEISYVEERTVAATLRGLLERTAKR